MLETFDFPDRLQARIAMLAVGHSTLRNQGAAGMVEHARRHLRAIDLHRFAALDAKQFYALLDGETLLLAAGFPGEGKGNWGAARKAINIFLRDVIYCRLLASHFELTYLQPWLEVPLDSDVHSGLSLDARPHKVPRWPGVKWLTAETSAALQQIASTIAQPLGISRVDLDVRYWRRARLDSLNSELELASGADQPLK